VVCGERGILANLPYYCSSPILVRLFEEWLPWVSRAGILLQEEVVDRLVSPPKTKQYGRLSVLTQIFSVAKKVRVIPPRLFIPKPEVSSAWCVINPHVPMPLVSPQEISRITAVCFAERRKTLLNNLAREMEKDDARNRLKKRESTKPASGNAGQRFLRNYSLQVRRSRQGIIGYRQALDPAFTE
jgi:16S rRNA (adenine1518-N6/adenine1519-N6)-dimethyltransferase